MRPGTSQARAWSITSFWTADLCRAASGLSCISGLFQKLNALLVAVFARQGQCSAAVPACERDVGARTKQLGDDGIVALPRCPHQGRVCPAVSLDVLALRHVLVETPRDLIRLHRHHRPDPPPTPVQPTLSCVLDRLLPLRGTLEGQRALSPISSFTGGRLIDLVLACHSINAQFNMVSEDEEERFAQLCEQIRRECFADARDADQVRALAGNHTILSLYVPCWQSIQLSPCSWHHSVLTFQSLHALIVGYARTRRRRRHRSPTLCSVHCESNSKLHQQPPSKWSGRGTVRMPCLRACEINPDIPRITGGVFRCCRRTLSTPKRVRSFSFRSPR